MTVLVCGGRDYSDYARVCRAFQGIDITRLVHGGAQGADALAASWASLRGIPIGVYRAEWRRYGKSAGPRRNQLMLDSERPSIVMAFPGGRGTADMVRRAKAAGALVLNVEQRSDEVRG